MTKVIHLAPHDPIPDPGPHGLVLRRLGEDDPAAIVTEIIFYGPHGGSTPARGEGGAQATLKQAVRQALASSAHHQASIIYVLDRTRGEREQEVIRAHGAHNFPDDILSDTDPEDNEQGSDLRDRPHDAGFMR